jgi:hypothetical protein
MGSPVVANRRSFRSLRSRIIPSCVNHAAQLVGALLIGGIMLHSSQVEAAEIDRPVNFRRDVAPLLEDHCLCCHNRDSAKGDLSLSTAKDLRSTEFVIPGKPEQSHLMAVIQPDGDEPAAMPKEGKPLSATQVDLLRRWIAAGADWPAEITLQIRSKADSTWWSLQPSANSNPPQTASPNKNPIDHFVRVKLDEKGLAPSPVADRRVLIRRLYFDLLGLPPTPESVASFVADPNPKAYERLSMNCWFRGISVNAGRGTGSTLLITQTLTGLSGTNVATTPGDTGITSFDRSTTTSRTTSFYGNKSLATRRRTQPQIRSSRQDFWLPGRGTSSVRLKPKVRS